MSSPVLARLAGDRNDSARRAFAIGSNSRELALALALANLVFPQAGVHAKRPLSERHVIGHGLVRQLFIADGAQPHSSLWSNGSPIVGTDQQKGRLARPVRQGSR